MILIAMSFIYLWGRHYWLVHTVLNNYMELKHKTKWDKMKEDTGWLRPKWATLYFSQAVFEYIWKSDNNFSDQELNLLKKKIKRFIWELPIYFVAVFISAFIEIAN